MKLKTKKGFTLIELILYIGVSSTMLVSLVLLLSTVTQSHVKNRAVNEVEYQSAQIINAIVHIGSRSGAVASPTPGTTSSTLTLDMPVSEEDQTVFDLNSAIVRIIQGATPAISLNNSRVEISNLLFENLASTNAPDTVRISFSAKHANPQNRNEYDYNKTFYGSFNLPN